MGIYVERVDPKRIYEARSIAIVIDVIRSFTVDAYAFAGGASKIFLVGHVNAARMLRRVYKDALLIGEINGKLIPGFDLNNSPAAIQAADLQGRHLIQFTGAGTRAAASIRYAQLIMLCAFTNAQATATYVRQLIGPDRFETFVTSPKYVSLLPSGSPTDFVYGDEDTLCADYLEALINERPNAPELLSQAITQLRTSNRFDLWKQNDPDLPIEDIDAVLDANRFNFAMVGIRKREWRGEAVHTNYVDVRRVDVAEAERTAVHKRLLDTIGSGTMTYLPSTSSRRIKQ
jgi:2-phosphosulfolactate phosphatase